MIYDVLKEVTSSQQLDNSSTPAYSAFRWLIDEDELVICPEDEKLIQRYVISKLYFQTLGDQWLECSRPSTSTSVAPTCNVPLRTDDRPSLEGDTWLNSTHECDWAFLNCDEDNCITRIEIDVSEFYDFPI